jgi:hypothetical protein
MKKIYFGVIVTLFLISFISASIFLQEEPNEIYNLQDKIELSLQIIPEGEFSELIILTLDCPTGETEIYKEYLFLTENITKDLIVPLVKEFIGENKGLCQIKIKLENETTPLSNKFTISDKIEISMDKINLIIPGQPITIQGIALRENGKNVNGSIEIKIELSDEEEIIIKEQIIDGTFLINFDLPENTKAGERIIKFYAYEQNKKSQITNEGNNTAFISIKQVPTNIEIQLEEKAITPGENLKFKIVMHDQTGEKIDSFAYIAIKNSKQEIINQIKKLTGETIEYPIEYNETPGTWIISTYSEEIINQVELEIKENKKIEIEIINNTLNIINKGNVPYNDILELKLGKEIIELSINLEVNQKEQYRLSAPEGEYVIEIGDYSKKVSLTGNTVKIKKLSNSKRTLNSTIAWIFLIIILGLATFTLFKKTHKKNFFGKIIPSKKKKEKIIEIDKTKNTLKGFINPKTKSEISLSISGSKQNACLGCISFKNYEEIKSGEGNVRETMHKIIELVEDKKGFMYQNKENLFFILAPAKTKTFQNEQDGIKIAEKIKSIFNDHNKIFKQKIDFGISLNYGTIVAREEHSGIKFMSMGTLLNTAKKLAKYAKKEIYIGQKIKERLGNNIKTELKNLGTISVHLFKELSKKGEHSKFIDGFVARQKKEIREKEHKEKKN